METNEYVFNPYQITDDKHGSNKLGMKAVFSETFVNERTLSCAFHMEQSVKNHKKYVTKESREFYANFCNSLKHSSTNEIFNSNEALLPSLISNQIRGNRKPLLNAPDFWLKSKHRWALCFRHSIHQIPCSGLAEAGQAPMNADSGKNLSLVDAVINSTVDSLHHEANIWSCQAGERPEERRPTGFELGEREEMPQVRRAMTFTEGCKANLSNISDSEIISSIFDKTR